jgi:hypothetical protein
MLKNIPLVLAAIAVLSLVAIASAAALDDDTPTPTPDAESATPTTTPDPSETLTPEPSDAPTDTPAPTDVPDEDEAEDDVDDIEEEGDGTKQAAAIAAMCGRSVEEIQAFHAEGVGWGALFKVCKLSVATGESVEDILADAAANGFRFGVRFGELTDEQKANLEGLPKNLGQAMKGDGDEAEDGESAKTDDSGGASNGKPKPSRGNGNGR